MSSPHDGKLVPDFDGWKSLREIRVGVIKSALSNLASGGPSALAVVGAIVALAYVACAVVASGWDSSSKALCVTLIAGGRVVVALFGANKHGPTNAAISNRREEGPAQSGDRRGNEQPPGPVDERNGGPEPPRSD